MDYFKMLTAVQAAEQAEAPAPGFKPLKADAPAKKKTAKPKTEPAPETEEVPLPEDDETDNPAEELEHEESEE